MTMAEQKSKHFGSSVYLCDDEACDNNEISANFRRRKRNWFLNAWFSFRRSLTPLNLLPMAIIALGSSVAFLAEPTRIDAGVITLMTACLSGLAIFVKLATDRIADLRRNSVQDRFEQLEDRAWELHESEERYRIVAEAFGDLVIVRDANADMNYCNEAFESVFQPSHRTKFTRSEKSVKNQLPDILMEQLEQPIPASKKREISLETKNGVKWFHWEDVPIRDEKHGGMGCLSVARDITAYKQSQQLDLAARQKAEEASKAKTKFLAMVSHEMRTPLNGIIGMSKLLENTKLDPEQKNYAAALTNSGENLLELINSMLDLTMIEAGRFETKTEAFQFSQFMNGTIELLSSRAYAKNIDCGLYLDPKIPEMISADISRLRQIVFNLAGNAIKFTAAGGVMVRCYWLDGMDSENNRLRIEVSDTGPGLKPMDQDRIFSEFERVDDEVTRKTDGAGLGLSISKALAKELGGELELSKTGPSGSTFTFELPVKITTEHSCEAQNSIRAEFSNHNVLIISSEKFEAECLKDTIQNNGGKAKITEDSDTAIAQLNANKEHITALILNVSSNSATSRKLKQIKAAASKQTKIILLALPHDKQKLNSHKKLMDGWLIRPVRTESLTLVLNGKASEDLEAPTKSAPIEPIEIAPTLKNSPRGTVLLAEDNDINALLVKSALNRSGIAVHRVENGKEAVDYYAATIKKPGKMPDIILMDMHMPVMDGLVAIKEIRAIELSHRQNDVKIPIYTLTADEQVETKNGALKVGADGFLVKPIDPNHLCKLVLDHLTLTENRLTKIS